MGYRTKEQILLSEDQTLPERLTEFDSKQYSTWEYPVGELGSEKYPHFSLFYINVNSRSKILKENGGTVSTQDTVLNNTAGTSLAKSIMKTELGAKIASVGGGMTSYKRIANAICLPMPQRVVANYNATYTPTDEVGILGAQLTAGASGQEGALRETMQQTAIPGLLGVGGGLAQQGVASASAAITGSETIGKLISKSKLDNPQLIQQINSKLMGTVINKRQEQLFRHMEFRSHHFQWLFLPRSPEESESLFRIARLFKEHQHPELDVKTGNSMLIMPSEFDIEFRSGDKQNERISKITTCALQSCVVDYTAVGEYIAFAGYSDPIAISLSLVFVEMEPLNRELIKKGY